MPELPDLEIFAVNLEKQFKNKELVKLEVVVSKKLNATEKELQEAFVGQKLKAVLREGKTLQLHFASGQVLGLHLMLHGAIRLLEKENETKFRIIEFWFKDGRGFALTDFQKQATPTLNPETSEVPDALSKEFNITYFKQLLSKKKTQIKQVLMDQKLIRGIGNTYADEILWDAKISPFSIAKAIPEMKVKDLYQSIEAVLRKEIMQLTRAIPDSFDTEVKDFLKVHNPSLKQSPTGHEIKIDKNGGRKTYYTIEQVEFQ